MLPELVTKSYPCDLELVLDCLIISLKIIIESKYDTGLYIYIPIEDISQIQQDLLCYQYVRIKCCDSISLQQASKSNFGLDDPISHSLFD